MMLVQHFRGPKALYNVNAHGNGIYFATDTKEIIHNGLVYLGNHSEEISDLVQLVEENKNSIEILNGDSEGSVKKQIDLAINDFATKISDDNTVNTFKELIDYAAENDKGIGDLILKVSDLENVNEEQSEKILELENNLNIVKDELIMKMESDHALLREYTDNQINDAMSWEDVL